MKLRDKINNLFCKIGITPQFIRFAISSLSSASLELIIFTLLTSFVFGKESLGLLLSTIISRTIATIINYIINKFWCFKYQKKEIKSFFEFAVLFIVKMLLSYVLVDLFSFLPIHITFVKMFFDLILFFLGYFVQRRFIFIHNKEKN